MYVITLAAACRTPSIYYYYYYYNTRIISCFDIFAKRNNIIFPSKSFIYFYFFKSDNQHLSTRQHFFHSHRTPMVLYAYRIRRFDFTNYIPTVNRNIVIYKPGRISIRYTRILIMAQVSIIDK